MENSKLKAFIPFYLVWSDDLLSQKEFLTLQKFIVSQNWLSKEEREFLKLLFHPSI
jgi:acyl-CoA oxidase